MGILYSDPSQDFPRPYIGPQIGFQMVPESFSLTDPVLFRHLLCLMVVVHNLFHIYLCCRQIRVCKKKDVPPNKLLDVMSHEVFIQARNLEMQYVELKLIKLVLDMIFSCIELYCSVFPFIYDITRRAYRYVEDESWENVSYMSLFSMYMMFRKFPAMCYNKLVLDRRYKRNELESRPMSGLICAAILMVVMIQAIIVPLTIMCIMIERYGGKYFVLFIWTFLVSVSIVFIIIMTLALVGRSKETPDANLLNVLQGPLADFKFPRNRVYVLKSSLIINVSVVIYSVCGVKRLVILDSLLLNQDKPDGDLHPGDVGKGLTPRQVSGYVAHQLAHHRMWHFMKAFFLLQFMLLLCLGIYNLYYNTLNIYLSAGFAQNYYPKMVGYWMIYTYMIPPLISVIKWIVYYIFRRYEYRADKMVYKMGYKTELNSALLKLFSDDIVYPYVDNWYLMFNRRKPSCLQRIQYMEYLETREPQESN